MVTDNSNECVFCCVFLITASVWHVFRGMLVLCHDFSPNHLNNSSSLAPPGGKNTYINWEASFSRTSRIAIVQVLSRFHPLSFLLCSDLLPSVDLDKDDALPRATNINSPEEKQPQETSTALVHAYTHAHMYKHTHGTLWCISDASE